MDALIDTGTADAVIAAHSTAIGTERVRLAQSAGRILRQTVRAETAQPPFNRVMMDGIAIRHRDNSCGVRFRLSGRQFAGASGAALPDDPACIEVATGAVLPDGADCVVPVEQLRREGDGYVLGAAAETAPWRFVHRAGVDCAAGAPVLEAGVRIGGPEMSMLASNGVAEVEVAAIPPIAVISTGDELVPPDAPLLPGRIRRSNDLALSASLQQHGFDRLSLHHVLDQEAALHAALREALASNRVLVLSGGVSMGQRDLVPDMLASLGVIKRFHGIAQRPGKPMWFGTGPDKQMVFALPGNPVSALVCMTRYVRPALLRAAGCPAPMERACALGEAGQPMRLSRFLPTRAAVSPTGRLEAHLGGWSNSGDFTALGGTQGFVELPPSRAVEPGEPVRFFRW